MTQTPPEGFRWWEPADCKPGEDPEDAVPDAYDKDGNWLTKEDK